MSKDEPIEQYVFPTPEPFRQHTALRTMNRHTLAHTPAPVHEQARRVAKAGHERLWPRTRQGGGGGRPPGRDDYIVHS